MRINLLRAHGSPSERHYQKGCRCAACLGQRHACQAVYRASHREERRTYNAAHREEIASYNATYRASHPEDREEAAARNAVYRAAHREEIAARHAAHRASHREEIAARNAVYRAAQYGLLPGEWEAMLATQGNCCAICGRDEPTVCGWQTDHDHATGRTRGILCHHCNTGLGHFRDNPEHLVAAAEYLALATS